MRRALGSSSLKHVARRASTIPCKNQFVISRKNVPLVHPVVGTHIRFSSTGTSATLPNIGHLGPYSARTHHCGELTANDVGKRVVLAGWMLPGRKVSKALSFFVLQDSHGTTQLLAKRPKGADDNAIAQELLSLPAESVVLVEGEVKARRPDAVRPDPTGAIEVEISRFQVLNVADRQMPFLPSDTQNLANEDLRARYRYLDLRRNALSSNLRKRSKVSHLIREYLFDQAFVEVETPMLLKSTPEGAREYLVPARTTSSSDEPRFYALSQSPQQPKQLLVCSGGVDKYFQFARCFRDEDGRTDRQPEFTQVDMEMAFVSWGEGTGEGLAKSNEWRIGGTEVRDVIEGIVKKVWKEVEGRTVESIPVMTYYDAMSRFGSDKPDTRFGLEISDITELLPEEIQLNLSKQGLMAEALIIRPGKDNMFLTAEKHCATEYAQSTTVERISIGADNLSTWATESRILNPDGSASYEVRQEAQVQPGDVIWVSTRTIRPVGGSTHLGKVRLRIAEQAQELGEYIPPADPHFLWVTEFPLFTRDDDDKEFLAAGRWSSSHHPFTAPMWQDMELLREGRYEEVRGQHYDLVLNGMEIAGGSVRVHDPQLQEYIFREVLKLTETEMNGFGHLLHALRCGAPPHGGIAIGFDRFMSILCNEKSIRQVIAFPKTAGGTDPLFKSPAPIEASVIRQYGLMPIKS